MATRDMKQIIEKTNVPERFEMTAYECMELMQEPELNAVWDAFKYGFALGVRYQKRKSKK